MDELDLQGFLPLDQEINFSALSPPLPLPLLDRTAPLPQNRPRNPRSCDFCRARKTACIIELTPPCTTCRNRGIECLFTERSSKRKRVDGPSATSGRDVIEDSAANDRPLSTGTQSPLDQSLPTSQSLPPPRPASTIQQQQQQPQQPQQQQQQQQPAAAAATDHSPLAHDGLFDGMSLLPTEEVPWRRDDEMEHQQPLDQPSMTVFLLGNTGEADPYLLKHSSLAAHAENQQFRRLYRDEKADPDHLLDTDRPLVFMLGDHSLYDKYEPQVDPQVLQTISNELSRISEEVGVRLVRLFFKYIYPYFPILSRSQVLFSHRPITETVAEMPMSLKAALYASALPFMIYDDILSTMPNVDLPSANSLYRIAWMAINHEIHTPGLSTVQSCLLLLQRNTSDRYVQGSPFQWSLLAWTVALAQALGLSTDTSTVDGIPAWEKRLRKRLWWATYVLDKWNFTNCGLTSHIRAEDFDVLPLTATDFASDTEDFPPTDQERLHERSHFYHLTRLTVILSDIVDAFFSLRASRAMESDFTRSSDLARGFRSRLRAWKANFDQFLSLEPEIWNRRTRLDGNASLYLAYLAVTILLFRALLRSLESPKGSVADKQLRERGRESVRLGAEACCVEVVNFLEGVQPGAWNAFWHKFSPSNFAIASSFMLRLLISSTSASETANLNELIDRWRWAMRTGGGNTDNSLMSLGLLRLDRSLLKSGVRIPGDTL